MGILELKHRYLGIEKLFQTLGCHMATIDKYQYKTGNKTGNKRSVFGFIRIQISLSLK